MDSRTGKSLAIRGDGSGSAWLVDCKNRSSHEDCDEAQTRHIHYPKGIPIRNEAELTALIRTMKVDLVTLSYSDLSHADVMHKASTIVAAGADFRLLGTHSTCLRSVKLVISICSVRTGAGKGPTSRYIHDRLTQAGLGVGDWSNQDHGFDDFMCRYAARMTGVESLRSTPLIAMSVTLTIPTKFIDCVRTISLRTLFFLITLQACSIVASSTT